MDRPTGAGNMKKIKLALILFTFAALCPVNFDFLRDHLYIDHRGVGPLDTKLFWNETYAMEVVGCDCGDVGGNRCVSCEYTLRSADC
ncbi:MAG: hypothetical protein IJ853_01350 [Rickettsiales bacterium]|nr:hypothetical protein [Rickettsiales bacterium]